MTRVSLPFDDPKIVVLAGDWHGNTRWAIACIETAAELGIRVIVHVGDFGVWPGTSGKSFLDELQRALEEHNMWIVFVDGNHEDFTQLPQKGELNALRSRIVHAQRGVRWKWHEMEWLAMGGAVSVDKQWRTPMRDWWPEESITMRQLEEAAAEGPADIMVCHDVPSGVDIPGLGDPRQWPVAEIVASEIHREQLRKLVDVVRPKLLFHGHYHVRYDAVLQGDGYTTEIRGLNLDGVDSNVLILPLVEDPSFA